MRTLLVASVLSLASFASAQCGTLAVQGTGAAGTTLTVSVSGTTAGGMVALVVGPTAGTTAINVGPLNLTLGLAQPFFPLPLGTADATGNVSVSFAIPSQVTQQVALNAQAATLGFTLRPLAITACASNVVAFTIG